MRKTNIVVTLQVEALHNWPDAKTKLPDVAFLSYPHRHIFHIKAKASVSHADRDIEIIMFKRELEDYFKRNFFQSHMNVIDFGARSCEMIANDLIDAFNLVSCEVLEDGENGAEVLA